jgi:hypothetical protein
VVLFHSRHSDSYLCRLVLVFVKDLFLVHIIVVSTKLFPILVFQETLLS